MYSRRYTEPAKIAIRKSRVKAMLGVLTHACPILLALFEICVNWHGAYDGIEVRRQAYYQSVAKAHEITIQASLALVILCCIQHEAIFGDGLPFGLFLGSLQFSQISYLWSYELWSPTVAQEFLLRRKLVIVPLLILCSLLATTAGPSSATLYVPRLIAWPLKPSYFSVNGTFEDIWPDYLDGKTVPRECAVLSEGDLHSSCPAGLWDQISEEFSLYNYVDHNTPKLLSSGLPLFLVDPQGKTQQVSVAQQCFSSIEGQACSAIMQDIILEGMYGVLTRWHKYTPFERPFQALDHSVSKGYFQPYSSVSCLSDLINEGNSKSPVQFPAIAETESKDRMVSSLPYLTNGQALRIPGNTSEFRLRWLELPPLITGSRAGVVLIHPSTNNSNAVNITACTLGAGWGASTAKASESRVTAGVLFNSHTNGLPNISSVPSTLDSLNDISFSRPIYANYSGYVYPQRRVILSTDWLEFLNPSIPMTETRNTTAMHRILTSSPGFTDGVAIPYALAVMLAGGLARTGVKLGYQGSFPITCDKNTGR